MSNVKTIVDNRTKQNSKKSSLSTRVEAKVSKGDVRGAVKLLLSTDTLANDDASTYNLLKEKHPLHIHQDRISQMNQTK